MSGKVVRELAEAVSLAYRGHNVVTTCPIHQDRHPSLSLGLSNNNNKLLVNCFAGCDPVSILREIERQGTYSQERSERKSQKYENADDRARKQRNIERTWAHALEAHNECLVGKYIIQARSLPLKSIPTALRFAPGAYCSQVDGFLPAMLACVEALDGTLLNVHRTYLADDGSGQAKIADPKLFMETPIPGAMKGGAIKLFRPDAILGLAEGIETALACHMISGLPVWSCMSAQLMPSVRIPDEVKRVVIFADNDKSGAGQNAAFALARRLSAEGRHVQVKIPPVEGRDWLDELCS